MRLSTIMLSAACAALAGTTLPAAAQTPAKPPANAPATAAKPLAPGQVAVKLQCRAMPDGSLKECKALDSSPKNPQAEEAAVRLAAQQRGQPPAGWPAAGKVLVLPVVLTPQPAG